MKRKLPLILLCLLFLGITGYFSARFFGEWNEYRAGEKAYEALAQHIYLEPTAAPREDPESPEISPSEIPGEETENTALPVVDFDALLEINPDVVAWIYIEGTNISYPVVQGQDNSYYLNHLIDGTVNGAGAIFLDYRNEKDLSDRNSVFYGHHMNNGTMFNQITAYKDQSFYDAHPAGLVITPGGCYRLEFFAGYITDMNSQAWKMEFASDEEYRLWLEQAISRSAFTAALKPEARDRVVTLSTCTYEYNDARFVLVGVMKPYFS